jgi:hypothetical protein
LEKTYRRSLGIERRRLPSGRARLGLVAPPPLQAGQSQPGLHRGVFSPGQFAPSVPGRLILAQGRVRLGQEAQTRGVPGLQSQHRLRRRPHGRVGVALGLQFRQTQPRLDGIGRVVQPAPAQGLGPVETIHRQKQAQQLGTQNRVVQSLRQGGAHHRLRRIKVAPALAGSGMT